MIKSNSKSVYFFCVLAFTTLSHYESHAQFIQPTISTVPITNAVSGQGSTNSVLPLTRGTETTQLLNNSKQGSQGSSTAAKPNTNSDSKASSEIKTKNSGVNSAEISTDNTDVRPSDIKGAKSLKDATTDFQRFVIASTGQSLPLYGMDLFSNQEIFSKSQSMPAPSAYVLGTGDELVIQVYGSVELEQVFVIDRDGRIFLPKAGPIILAGVVLSDVEKVLTNHIAKVFRNFNLTVSLRKIRSVEVFVLGQAVKPGKHLVNGMSGLVNALFETGGPNINGSMRGIELRRAGKTVATIDMYSFLSKGENASDVPVLAGDIIYIPSVQERAAIIGAVNTPAIYELKNGETIEQILMLSGGLPTLAAPQKVLLERLDSKREIARYVEEFPLDEAGRKLTLKGGDILTLFQISPQFANVVTLQGNVASPLKYNFRAGMRVSDLLSDRRLLIPGSYWTKLNEGSLANNYSNPEVNLDYATIQRLDQITLRTKTFGFNLAKAIAKDPIENIELISGDILTVYSPKEAGAETENSVSVTGEIVGGTKRFVWRDGFTIRDIIPSTQWLVDYYGYWQRESARSLKNDINWDYAQVIRRIPKTLENKAITFNLGKAVLQNSPDDDIKLEPGDQIALFTTSQLPVPVAKRAQLVTLSGEVMSPGRYQVKPGESLNELIDRAGGLTKNAYIYGTIFTRESTRQQQQENLNKSIRLMQNAISSQTATAMQNVTDSEKASTSKAQLEGQKVLLERMQSLKATGRVALDLDPEKPKFPTIILEDGDVISVPVQPSFVGVFGEVYSENSMIYKPELTADDYLKKAGPSRDADLDNTLLVRADGTIQNFSAGGWMSNIGFSSNKIKPGDTLFVPSILDRRTVMSMFVQGAKDWTTIIYQFAIGAAAFKTLKN
jgi:protein involved in polysaccharide export with SLBB domain